MNYIELNLHVEPTFAEILIAELAEIGFESFVDIDGGIAAYITEDIFDDIQLKQLIERYADKTPMHYEINAVAKTNWNEEWESNFSPINVVDKIFVRATFHEPATDGFQHEIIITPKMSFGTGHHETTSQVMELQLGIDHKNKTVLDVGTGTGILAILAVKLGASKVMAFDIDEWSVENTLENIELNNTHGIITELGTIDDQQVVQYDIVIANINRNILLSEIPKYAQFLEKEGILVVSGFYENDVENIAAVAKENYLIKQQQISKNNWAAVVFKKE